MHAVRACGPSDDTSWMRSTDTTSQICRQDFLFTPPLSLPLDSAFSPSPLCLWRVCWGAPLQPQFSDPRSPLWTPVFSKSPVCGVCVGAQPYSLHSPIPDLRSVPSVPLGYAPTASHLHSAIYTLGLLLSSALGANPSSLNSPIPDLHSLP